MGGCACVPVLIFITNWMQGQGGVLEDLTEILEDLNEIEQT